MKNFPNGCARSNTGYRAVLFSSAGELRPVAYSVESGYTPERGTVQVAPRKGDLIAQVEWNRRGEEFSLLRVNADHEGGESMYLAAEPVSFNDQPALWTMLKDRHPWLDEWLVPVSRGTSYLPTEAWGGETLAARAKRERCEEAIRRFGLPLTYSQEWVISPKSGLNTRPAPLDFDPDKYQASWHSWDGSMVGISRRERFFSSAGNGAPAVELFPVLEEEHGSNYAYEETVRRQGQPGIPGWNDRRFLVRVVSGAYTREHHSYGVKLDIWDTTQTTAALAV